MKKLLIILSLFVFSVASAQVATEIFKSGKKHSIDWDAPTLNEDGTVLTDLAGYKIGIFPQGSDVSITTPIYVQDTLDATLTEYKLVDLLTNAGLDKGIYTVSATAYDDYGNESVWADPIDVDAKIVNPGKPINVNSKK